MKSLNWPKPGYATISNIPYNLIFTAKFNDSSILITIISCDYLNLSLADEHAGDVTIPTQVIEYNQNFSRRISQSDWNIQIKLNYMMIIQDCISFNVYICGLYISILPHPYVYAIELEGQRLKPRHPIHLIVFMFVSYMPSYYMNGDAKV